jgi:hypothetical protein
MCKSQGMLEILTGDAAFCNGRRNRNKSFILSLLMESIGSFGADRAVAF